jgi:uncharacterized protein (TIGR02646 family)
MRPVARGAWPTDGNGGLVAFVHYKDAKPHLVERLGPYCSFCERRVSSGLAVEHIRHKHNNPTLKCDWSNFLLACTNCNSIKGTKLDTAADEVYYLLPHRDRTFEVFDYCDGLVRIAQRGNPQLEQRATETIALVGLDRTAAHQSAVQLRQARDTRYLDRRRAWQKARKAQDDLAQVDTPIMRERILAEAEDVGFWSIWMTVFANDKAMCADLCHQRSFVGTDPLRI